MSNLIGRTLYDILGVEPDAPTEKVRAIYRLRSREVYPRRPGTGNEVLQRQLNEAYAILRNNSQRHDYNIQMGLPLPRPLKPGTPIYAEIKVARDAFTANGQIPYTFSRWEPCGRCWGEGCSRCQSKGKSIEKVSLEVTIPAGATQVLVEGQGAITELGGSRGDLILYVIWS